MVYTADGERLEAARKNCKGDPELALDADEMRAKALGLLAYGGLDESAAQALCDDILSLPATAHPPALFTRFMHHLGLT